jgi:plastocyanin
MLGTIVCVAACGNSSSPTKTDAPKSIDAPKAVDAPSSNTVQTVSCTGATIAATVTTPNDEHVYVSTPSSGSATNGTSTINVGDIIEFMPSDDHPVGPNTGSTGGMSDPGLVAPGGATTCLKFTEAGTFHYWCTIHLFTAIVTVNS